jgi:hypothetical protein
LVDLNHQAVETQGDWKFIKRLVVVTRKTDVKCVQAVIVWWPGSAPAAPDPIRWLYQG